MSGTGGKFAAIHFLFYLLKIFKQAAISSYHHEVHLLIIVVEDLLVVVLGQESPIADLEAALHRVNNLDILLSQLKAINLVVGLDAARADRLGDDAAALGDVPHQHNLLRRAALLLSELEEGGILVQRRGGGAEAGVCGGVDALGGVVGDELGRWVVGVEFDLVNSWDNLKLLLVSTPHESLRAV